MNRRQRRALKKAGITESVHQLLIDETRKRARYALMDLIDYKIEHDLDCTKELLRLAKL